MKDWRKTFFPTAFQTFFFKQVCCGINLFKDKMLAFRKFISKTKGLQACFLYVFPLSCIALSFVHLHVNANVGTHHRSNEIPR